MECYYWFTQGSRSGCNAQPESGQNRIDNCNTMLMATERSRGTGRKAQYITTYLNSGLPLYNSTYRSYPSLFPCIVPSPIRDCVPARVFTGRSGVRVVFNLFTCFFTQLCIRYNCKMHSGPYLYNHIFRWAFRCPDRYMPGDRSRDSVVPGQLFNSYRDWLIRNWDFGVP